MSHKSILTRFGGIVVGGLMFCMASAANAGLINVKSVEITSALPSYLQIAEVLLIETGTLSDLALGGTATATGTGNWVPASNPDKAIDGSYPSAYPDIYHSDGAGADEMLTVTLNVAAELNSITIYGRMNDTYRYRDVYNVSFLDENGSVLYSLSGLSANNARYFGSADLPNTRVPEPGTIAVFGFGLAGLGLMRRRKRVAA